MRLDVGVLAHEGAVDESLILKEVVEGAEHVRLVVVPPQRVVLPVMTTVTVVAAANRRTSGWVTPGLTPGLGRRRGGRGC